MPKPSFSLHAHDVHGAAVIAAPCCRLYTQSARSAPARAKSARGSRKSALNRAVSRGRGPAAGSVDLDRRLDQVQAHEQHDVGERPDLVALQVAPAELEVVLVVERARKRCAAVRAKRKRLDTRIRVDPAAMRSKRAEEPQLDLFMTRKCRSHLGLSDKTPGRRSAGPFGRAIMRTPAASKLVLYGRAGPASCDACGARCLRRGEDVAGRTRRSSLARAEPPVRVARVARATVELRPASRAGDRYAKRRRA